MLITELTVKKEQQRYIEKKLNLIKTFFGLYIFIGLLAIAHLIYCGVCGITDYTPYLFSGFSVAGAIGYMAIMVLEWKNINYVNSSIISNGEGVLRMSYNVNLKHNRSGNTYVNWVAFAICLICTIIILITQFINFNAVELSNLIICVTLTVVMLYQSLNSSIYDNLYHECILGKNK